MTELAPVSDSSNGSSSSAAAVAASSSLPSQALLERLKDYGQQDALSLWDELSREEQDLLIKDIECLDLPRIDLIIRCSLLSQGLSTPTIEPVPGTSVSSVEERTLEERERWWKMGLKAISEGKLAVILLSGGQVCLHMFTLDFLNQVANGLEKDSIYHLAEKKIPSTHGYTMGLKLEQFIFDAFIYAPSTALFEVIREEEFAPVKNANGSKFDTPDSARSLVLRLHTRWVVAAGGFLTHSVPLYATGVEISPLCSYAGENLEVICRGRTFHAPCEITF